ncbi:MAG: hypothetical protein QXW94_03270 [Desulfurococcaceae archaeon]
MAESMAAERLIEIIRQIVKSMRSDFAYSSSKGIVRDREQVYRAFYKVSPISSYQDKPIIFTDAGFHSLEADVSSLIVVNVGAQIRRENGVLQSLSDILDYPPYETYFMYGRLVQENGSPLFFLQILPLDECPLLLNEGKAAEASREITEMLNRGYRGGIDIERSTKLFRKFVKYTEGLLELAYALKLAEQVRVNTVSVVDGTLARWFGVKTIKFLGLEGLDILIALTGLSREDLISRLSNICGLVKTTKFTSVARARWLFKNTTKSPSGLYTYIDEGSVEKAAELLSDIRRKYGEKSAHETISIFNRVIHAKSGIYSTRFPLTTDGTLIMHLELHSNNPVIEYDQTNKEIRTYPKTANELMKRINEFTSNITAYRTPEEGLPPHGFMEVDRLVRIPNKLFFAIEELFRHTIREETGEMGHPLEYLFDVTRKMRLR